MSKKTKTFDAFGVQYRTESFSAVYGLEMMARPDGAHPCELLCRTEAKNAKGEWIALDSKESVNDLVIDVANVLAPRIVLDGILSLIHDFNFKFLEDWKSAKIPPRFVDGAQTVSSRNIDPMASQLIQDGVATLRELEDYYSLEDAFKMFDTIMVKGINQALSNEASMKKNKKG
jgi:hypothetical protein